VVSCVPASIGATLFPLMVDDMEPAEAIWTFLGRLFKARSKERAVDLWREFFTTKQKQTETAMEFVAHVDMRGRELRDACRQVVSDEMLTGVIDECVLSVHKQVVQALQVAKSLAVGALKEELSTADCSATIVRQLYDRVDNTSHRARPWRR
jgi:hypothetical protein